MTPFKLTPSAKHNRLLAALSVNEYARLQDDWVVVSLKLGDVLYRAGDTLRYMYFPITCIVSLVFTTQNGSSAELALTGNDGLVGIPLVLGGDITAHTAVVQSAGAAYRLKAEVMRWELEQGGEMQRLALRYTQALMTQMAQSVVCNRHHTVDQQLCRWLLLSFDRLAGNQLNMTQSLIGNMLGVRREAVTKAAGKLQAVGLIRFNRGHIEMLDRPGLEARACECYAVVKAEDDRLFQPLPATHRQNRVRPNPATLRQRAEALLRQAPKSTPQTPWDTNQQMHELEVHQIELEMHNLELHQAYDEANSLRERYADIYDFAPFAYFTLDFHGTILDLNLAGALLLGIERTQKGRQRFDAYVSPTCRALFKQFVTSVLQTSQKTVCECMLTPNKERSEANVKIEGIPNTARDECRMVVIDLSIERKAEQSLRVREQYLRATIDNFPFLVWLKDEKSRFLAVNTPFATNFGWPSAESLVGKSDHDIASRDLAKVYRADDLSVLSSGVQKTVEELIESKGEKRWFETFKSPVSLDGQRIGTVGFAHDITERHNTQQDLKDSEARHRGFIENLPVSVAITQDGLIKYINPTGLALIGYSAEECIGKSFLPLVFTPDQPKAIEAHQRRGQGDQAPDDYEIRLVTKEGNILDCRTHVRNIEYEGHIAALAIFEDVTEQKQMEVELRSLASTDALTGLPNRRHFFARLEETLSRLKRGVDTQVAVLMLDLDHFKNVNDTLGHAAGDTVLRHVSSQLNEELRMGDIAGRIGGEEFAVLLLEADESEAAIFAERVRQKIAKTAVLIGHRHLSITVSIGIAAMKATDENADESLLRADRALYRAKENGRDKVEIANEADIVQSALWTLASQNNNQGVQGNAEQNEKTNSA